MSAKAKSVIFWMVREHPNRKPTSPRGSQGNSESDMALLAVVYVFSRWDDQSTAFVYISCSR